MSSPRYPHSGLPLTPSLFGELTLQLVPTESPVNRKELCELVSTHHAERGGEPARGSLVSVAKKALQNLQKQGRAEATGVPGYWRIAPDPLAVDLDQPLDLGVGNETLYVYFFPAYRDQAAYLGRDTWPIKVGMSTTDAGLRMRDQVGTAMPERPVVGMLYRTDDARTLERLVHSTLRTRGRHLKDAPGSEWFLSSVQEVRSIIEFSHEEESA